MQYNIIKYSPHAIHCIPMTYYNWKFILFDPMYPFHQLPTCPWQPSVCLCVNLLFFFFHFNFAYKWDHRYLSFSVWPITLSIMPSRPIHIVTNCKILLFFYGWIKTHCILYIYVCILIYFTYIPIYLYTYATFSLSIHPLLNV